MFSRPLALLFFLFVNSASQSNATGFENVENDMFVIFRLPKRSRNNNNNNNNNNILLFDN